MARQLFIVLTVLAVEITTCFGQYGGGKKGGAMREMMGGGLAAMMGGDGMRKLGAMMDGCSDGGTGAAIDEMEINGSMANAMYSIMEAVHFIVGPEAKPDKLLTDYAMSQKKSPRNLQEMLPYLTHFERIANNTYGSCLETLSTLTPGKSLAQLQTDLETIVMKRAMRYSRRPKPQRPAAGTGNMTESSNDSKNGTKDHSIIYVILLQFVMLDFLK